MSVFVVDSSVVMTYLFTERYTVQATAFFMQDKTREFFVPEFCLVECANVIWKRTRFQGFSIADATIAMRALRKLPLERSPVKALLPQSLTIALQHSLAVYDAVYIAMAMQGNYPLVTLDQKQAAAAFAEGLTTIPITNF